MKSTLFQGLYIGPKVRTPEVTLKPGRLVRIARIQITPDFEYWEAAHLRAKPDAEWPKVDRLDLVIPGHEAEADQLRMLLLDTSSSASRQHYIDTGEYLSGGEALQV